MKVLNNISLDFATASKALKLDSSKNIVPGTPSDTEQGYEAGVTSAIQTQFTNKCNSDLRINTALGSVVLAQTIPVYGITGNTGAFTDGRMYFIAVWLEKDATINGVKFYQATQGAFTADNNNKVGLYSYSAGTMTLIASNTVTDANLWKAASNTWTSKAFTTPYAAVAGLYFVGFLYNSSAQTTAPVLGGTQIDSLAAQLDYTNSAKLSCYINTQTDLPGSQAHSGLTINIMVPYFALY